jgi:hypothetical protein
VLRRDSSGDDMAVTHGAYSEGRSNQRAKTLANWWRNRSGIRAGELTGTQAALLRQWSTTTAKAELIDAYIAEHGLMRADGTPQPAMQLYVALVNSARHALTKLQQSLGNRPRRDELADYLAANYGDDETD